MRLSHRIALLALLPWLLAAEAPYEAKRDQLAREALELAARESVLRVLEADIGQTLEELEGLHEQVVRVVAPGNAARQERLEILISFYQAMKPKQAARLLEQLPLQLAVEVLGAMQSRGAGKIFDVMKPERAVRISKLMAEKRR